LQLNKDKLFIGGKVIYQKDKEKGCNIAHFKVTANVKVLQKSKKSNNEIFGERPYFLAIGYTRD